MEKTTLLNNGKIINHIRHFGRTQIQKCLLLLLRNILALNWVCLALSMVHFLWEKHCSSDFFFFSFFFTLCVGIARPTDVSITESNENAFPLAFGAFHFRSFFSFFPYFSFFHITFLLFSFYPQIQSKHIYLFAKWLLALKWWQHWNRHTIRENFVFALSDVHFVQKA